jgi:squalene-hopene/tetraprenyl-beta-curcumene cyclase
MMRILAVAAAVMVAAPAWGIDEAHQKKAAAIAEKATAWLKTQQDEKTGGWAVPKEGPAYPAITGLVVNGMMMEPGVDPKAPPPAVAKGVAYILSMRKPDGGIYDTMLPTYNTAICLSALSRIDTPEAKAAIKPAQDFLKSLQFGENAATTGTMAAETAKVGKDDPNYGGIGYGNHGRPDLSNTAFFLQALQDSGVPGDDPAVQAALVFLRRTQMVEKGADGKTINEMPYAKGSKQGGFIYATGEERTSPGTGSSEAPTKIEETMDDGTKVSHLRAYGSMTYAGFKSLIYAQLAPTDPRVVAAMGWIKKNYTLAENPGIGKNGMYYYLLTFGRAMKAVDGMGSGSAHHLMIPDASGTEVARDWANDLIDRLAELQNPDGSFTSVDKRWMENNPVLITAYALLAVQQAR